MVDSIFLNKNDLDKRFENQTFTNYIFEKDIKTEGDIIFINCTFKFTFCLENIEAREFSFLDCNFEGLFYLSNASFALGGFTNCIFFKETNLTSIKTSSFFVLRNITANELNINGEYHRL